MRALLLLALLPAMALAQGRPNQGGGGGVCTLNPATQAVATSYRATTTTGTAYQVDAVLTCGIDLGPGTNNCIGTNVAGDVILGPASGNSTTGRIYGSFYISNILQAGGQVDVFGSSSHLANTFPATAVKVTDSDGFQINGTTAIKGWVQAAVAVDFAAINNSACATQSVTVTGAATGDGAWANADFALPLGVSIGNVRVTAANTVELTLCNSTTAGPLDPSSGNFIFRLSR